VSWHPRAVVFDFDGVLADTEALHLAAFQDVFGRRGWPLDRPTYFSRYLSFDDRELLRAYAADHQLRLAEPEVRRILAEKEGVYRGRIGDGDVLFAGARACVERLAGRFRLAVATGALRAEVVDVLTGAGLVGAFDAIVSADDVSSSKPSPEPYLTAAARLGVPAADCAAIEDSRGGLASALGAGMRTIAITTSLPASALTAAHAIVDELNEITVESIEALAAARSS